MKRLTVKSEGAHSKMPVATSEAFTVEATCIASVAVASYFAQVGVLAVAAVLLRQATEVIRWIPYS